MKEFIQTLIAFVSQHAWLAYFTLFLAALLEAVPVLGSVVPGSTIIIALSALVPDGELQIVPVFLAAISGALIGDAAAFWAGHNYKREILTAWPMSRYPKLVEQSDAFFDRFGALAVFFARFVPPIRAFVPLTAGTTGMPPLRFHLIDTAAVLVWAPVHILPGVLAVSAFERFGGAAKHYWMPIVLVVAAVIGIVTWTRRRRKGINVPA